MSSRSTSNELNKEHNSDYVCSLSLAPTPGDWSQWQNMGNHKETREQSYVEAIASHLNQDPSKNTGLVSYFMKRVFLDLIHLGSTV